MSTLKKEATTIAIALLAAMLAGSLLILIYGESPLAVYRVMLARTWGDSYGLGQVLFKATPLVFTGLAVAMALHAGLLNIGAEGQMFVGAFFTALAGIAVGHLPALLAVPLCLLAGAAAGGLYGAVPGVLKARFGAHEVLSTIMLNFIAYGTVLWLGRRFFFVEQTVHTESIGDSARLPSLGLGGSAGSVAFFLALFCAAACLYALYRTRSGFAMRVVGHNPDAAQTGGISVGRTVVIAMTVSGALAGLVGSGTVLGYKGYYEQGVGSGAGFMGIAVALLARNHPIGIVLAALFFATLSHGGLAANAFVPKEIIDVLQAVVVLAVAITSAELRRLLPRTVT